MSAAVTDKPLICRATLLEAAAALRLVGGSASASACLIRMLCDETVGADELSIRIERDPVLCARVLRIANSPYYAQQRSVTSIRRALLVVGLNAVRGIAAAACIDQVMPPRVAVLPDTPALLQHSLATGLASEMLAACRFPGLMAEAFIAGLLHNMGVIIQAIVDPSGTATMIASLGSQAPTDIRALEQRHATIAHEEAIAVVFDAWQLPDSLIAAASHHHLPAEAPERHRPLAMLVGTGARLSAASGNAFSLEPTELPLASDEELPDLLNLSERELSTFREELPKRVAHLMTALG
jgi:HD-like signal output (HDOD) protein